MRVDFENPAPLEAEISGAVLANLEAALAGADMLCIEDYNKGLLSPELCRQAIALARRRNIPVMIDPAAINDYSKYAGATALKLNRTETQKATGLPVENEEQYAAAGALLLERLGLEAAVITLDKNGAYLATREGDRRWLRTRQRHVYDVTGAGDMVLAMLAVAAVRRGGLAGGGALANCGGGLEVEKCWIDPDYAAGDYSGVA